METELAKLFEIPYRAWMITCCKKYMAFQGILARFWMRLRIFWIKNCFVGGAGLNLSCFLGVMEPFGIRIVGSVYRK